MATRLLLSVLIAVAVLFATMATTAEAMITKVGAKERFCVSKYVKSDQHLYFQFQVVAGGKLDIDTFIYDAAGRQIKEFVLQTTGDFDLIGDAQNDHYKFCFSNEMARFTPKWVEFTVRRGQLAGPDGGGAIADSKHIDPIEQKISHLRHSIDSLHDAQQRLKVAEKDHRATIEDSNERILLWAVFEVVAFFAMGIFQIFFLKRFLERKTVA